MSTPEASSSCPIKNKYSPFSSGISKSLLTPCRQVGLSRKRKTPVNNLKSVSEESPSNNSNINTIKTCSEDETTPVTHNKFIKRKRNLNPLSLSHTSDLGSPTVKVEGNKGLLDNCDIKSSKKDLLKIFTSEDIFDSENDHPSLEDEAVIEYSDKTLCVKINRVCVPNEECVTNNNDAEPSNFYDKSNRKSKKRRLLNDTLNFEYTKNKSTSQTTENNFCNDFVNSTINEKIHKNQTASTEDNPLKYDNVTEYNSIKNCKIQIQKLSENEINFTSNKFVEKTLSVKALSKRCSSSISDDADFFTSTPEEEKTKRKRLETKVRLLEGQIKQKQFTLENLQRASIYKSKHNIQDLKQLTSIWMEGCVQALKDLLTHLQAHGPIDLTTVLTNMKIPKEIVAKLPL